MNADIALLDSRYSWTRLAISLAIAMVGNVGMWSIIVVMPAIQAEFGVDRAAASLPYTLTMVGFAFGNMAIGRVVDRFAARRCWCSRGCNCSLASARRPVSGRSLPISRCGS
jgi:MFS family permease